MDMIPEKYASCIQIPSLITFLDHVHKTTYLSRLTSEEYEKLIGVAIQYQHYSQRPNPPRPEVLFILTLGITDSF
ncbi:hypothetical protein FJTKL_09584 [Diaporthe vaccinii]|uniref:Uncharacterized protein n=1 Tax=Diaporthe vaccinii TaxID=105482 RepID=A0ABR4EMX5_9PEZI